MDKYVIVVAGGSGSRMQSTLPKQFIKIGKKPILMHTIECFIKFSDQIKIILVLPENEIITWQNLCKQYNFTINHIIIKGGKTRFESVKNGFKSIDEINSIVAIHDGVRPFITNEIINESFLTAQKYGTAVTSIHSKDSVRKINDDGTNTSINRESIRIIQTPQTFQYQVLKDAFDKASHTNFTDDASVAEAAGYSIHLIEGSYKNIKITSPEDLIIVELFLKKE